MQRIPSGTKVRIPSGHEGWVQDHSGDAVEIAFFYMNNRGQHIDIYWIAAADVYPIKREKDDEKEG